MLKSIAEGKEKSQVILIEDSVAQNGQGLLNSFITYLAKRVDALHIILYDSHPDFFFEGLPSLPQQKIYLHDGVSDPLGWSKEAAASNPSDGNSASQITLETDLCEHILSKAANQGKVAVVIDSLSNLLLHREVPHTCRVLNKLVTQKDVEITQVVSLLHSDLHDAPSLQQVHHCVSTIMTLSPPSQPGFFALCNTLHKKVTGKVLKKKEHFTLTADFMLDSVEELLSLDISGTASSGPDPAANLTFNLTLSDREKEARSQLQLPYMHHQKKKELAVESPGTGKIFYQPDEADDFDEEDPDDDLDI